MTEKYKREKSTQHQMLPGMVGQLRFILLLKNWVQCKKIIVTGRLLLREKKSNRSVTLLSKETFLTKALFKGHLQLTGNFEIHIEIDNSQLNQTGKKMIKTFTTMI